MSFSGRPDDPVDDLLFLDLSDSHLGRHEFGAPGGGGHLHPLHLLSLQRLLPVGDLETLGVLRSPPSAYERAGSHRESGSLSVETHKIPAT